TAKELHLGASDLNFTESYAFAEVFEECRAASENWLCVVLTNPSAGVGDSSLQLRAQLRYIPANGDADEVTNQSTIYSPDVILSLPLDPQSSLEDIRFIP